MISILFVCLGNICRSPALEACLKHLVEESGLSEEIRIQSCALGSSYLGSPAHPSVISAAKRRGIKVATTAKLFDPDHFKDFDYVFAVTEEMKNHLEMIASDEYKKKIYLATAFSQKYQGQDIPDPLYRDEKAFEHILEMSYDAAFGILEMIKKRHEIAPL